MTQAFTSDAEIVETLRAIEAAGGSQREASRVLGIDRDTVKAEQQDQAVETALVQIAFDSHVISPASATCLFEKRARRRRHG